MWDFSELGNVPSVHFFMNLTVQNLNVCTVHIFKSALKRVHEQAYTSVQFFLLFSTLSLNKFSLYPQK